MKTEEEIIASGMIEAYLLWQLSPAERRAFEAILPQMPLLRAALRVQETLITDCEEAPPPLIPMPYERADGALTRLLRMTRESGKAMRQALLHRFSYNETIYLLLIAACIILGLLYLLLGSF
jgi:hypothetical protein